MNQLTTFEDAQQVLAAKLPGYARRPHQMALALKVEQALLGKVGGLLQAACGTGKSFAALIPAILATDEDGFHVRTVVGTATKALQDQYRRDLAFLAENLTPFTWAILKGRSNYPCWLKIRELQSPTRGLARIGQELLTLEPAEIADRESLPAVTDGEWSKISMSPSECVGAKHCPFARQCHAELAKKRAQEARVVVTNLAYLCTDLVIRQKTGGDVQLLGEYQQLIIDEAHNLHDVATSALSDKIGEHSIIKLARDTETFLHDQLRDAACAQLLEDQVRSLWSTLAGIYADRNRGNREPSPARLSPKDVISLGEELLALIEALRTARDEVTAVRGLDKDTEPRAYVARIRLMNRLAEWSGRITSLLAPEERVLWLETEDSEFRGERETRLYLHNAPLSPAKWLRSVIWDDIPAVMLSATLAVGRDRRTGAPDFGYVRRQVGLRDGEAVEFDAGTPFDFATQAQLYVPPANTPQPTNGSQNAWQAYTYTATRQLVEAADGNALLLFTSRRNMEATYKVLSSGFRARGLNVLKQGDAPTPELIRELKGGRAVLFGLKTFFEGIDIQGQAVSLVVIDKLPFAVPSDVLVQARAEDLRLRYHNDWADWNLMTVPSMSLTLIQGVGRLIRTVSDRGVMAVLDPRLEAKSYGKKIQASLPAAPKTTDLAIAVSFLQAARH